MTYQITIDDYICNWYYSKQFLRQELAKFKGKHVDMKISSLGGDLDHGFDMYQQLRDHGNVTVHLSGFVASAATVIAMGAKKVTMSRHSSLFLVHKCSNYVDVSSYLNADEMREAISSLEHNASENDKIDRMLASLYAEKTGRPADEMMDLLTAADWMTPEEALAHGFVDELTDDEPTGKLDFSPAMASKFNALGFPEPPVSHPSSSFPVDSLVSRIVSRLGAILRPTTSPTNPTNMSKHEFKNISGVVSGVSFEGDTEISVKVDTLTAIDAALKEKTDKVAELESSLTAKDSKISELEAQVNALKNNPADESTDTHDEGGETETFTVNDILDSIKHC